MPVRPALKVRFRRPPPGARAVGRRVTEGDGEIRTHTRLFTRQLLYRFELHRRRLTGARGLSLPQEARQTRAVTSAGPSLAPRYDCR